MIKVVDVQKCASFLKINSCDFFTDDLIVTTDSRSVEEKNTFISLKGERFDGNHFIDSVIENGIKVVIAGFDKEQQFVDYVQKYPGVTFVFVTDTYSFLLELGSIASRKWQEAGGLMIGITGSNGKTTNKEMLFSLLSDIEPGSVHKTSGNLNNHIGVPLTLLGLTIDKKVAVVEMGMNNKGEILPLAMAANPRAGLITSIGPAHIENLGTLENIFLEKKSLFDAIESLERDDKEKAFVMNDRDEYLTRLPSHSWCHRLGDYHFSIKENGFTIDFNGHHYQVNNQSLYGDYNKINLAQCLLLALVLYPQKAAELVAASSRFRMPPMNRGEFRVMGKTHVFLDAYNANPSSMSASLASFEDYCVQQGIAQNERWYILGDMNELGNHSESYHQQIGKLLKDSGVRHVSFVGRYRDHYSEGFAGNASLFEDEDQLKKAFLEDFKKYKSIFIKASRSLQLESIVDINEDLNLN